MKHWSTRVLFALLALALCGLAWAQATTTTPPAATPATTPPATTPVATPATTPPAKKTSPYTPENLSTLTGTVKQLIAPAAGKSGAEVKMLLATDTTTTDISLAPAGYLTRIGLALKQDDKVTVTGWTIDLKKGTRFDVQDVTQDGKTYPIRNKTGGKLWNEFDGYTVATETGKISQIVTPDADPTHKSRKDVACTLTTDKLARPVELTSVTHLAELGLDLKEGDQVTILGWLRPVKGQANDTMIVRSVTVNDKTYAVRDEAGKLIGTAKHKTLKAK